MSNVNKDHFTDMETGPVPNIVTDANAGAMGEPMVVLARPATDNLLESPRASEPAAFVNPTDYEDYWRNHFYAAEYYVSGLVWSDYHPTYRLGYDAYFSNHGRSFDDVEAELLHSWEAIKGTSHLTWPQAKQAVRDGWRFVESAVTGTRTPPIH